MLVCSVRYQDALPLVLAAVLPVQRVALRVIGKRSPRMRLFLYPGILIIGAFCDIFYFKAHLMRHRWEYGFNRAPHRPRMRLFLCPSCRSGFPRSTASSEQTALRSPPPAARSRHAPLLLLFPTAPAALGCRGSPVFGRSGVGGGGQDRSPPPYSFSRHAAVA